MDLNTTDSSASLLGPHKDSSISKEKPSTEVKRSSITVKDQFWVVAIYALIACIGTVVTGFSQGYTSSTFLRLEDIYDDGDSDHAFKQDSIYGSLFGALGPVGALFGAPVAWPLSDRLGRKPALMLMGIPALIGWLMITYAHLAPGQAGFLTLLLLGRMFTGFGAGWTIFCVSVYVAEISSARLKGVFGACNQLFNTLGILIVYGLGAISDNVGGNFDYYHISLCAIGVLVIFEFLMLFTPETPRWLYSHRKDLEAKKILNLLRGPNADIPKEIRGIKRALENQGHLSIGDRLQEFKHRSVYIPFIIVLFLMLFQQFSGINVAIFYGGGIVKDAGVSNPAVAIVYIGVVQVIATLFAVMLVDYLGRKVLLIFSSIGLAISSAMLGIHFLLKDTICQNNIGGAAKGHDDLPSLCLNDFSPLAIVSLVIFIAAFSIAWGPIPWLAMAELLPLRVRSVAGSFATAFNWTCAAIVTVAFRPYRDAVTSKVAWWTFSIIMVISVVWLILFFPETRGHSLEEIEMYFEEGTFFLLALAAARKGILPVMLLLNGLTYYNRSQQYNNFRCDWCACN